MALFQKENEYFKLIKWCLTVIIAIFNTATIRIIKRSNGSSIKYALWYTAIVGYSAVATSLLHRERYKYMLLWLICIIIPSYVVCKKFLDYIEVNLSNDPNILWYENITIGLLVVHYIRLVFLSITTPPMFYAAFFLFLSDAAQMFIDSAITGLVTKHYFQTPSPAQLQGVTIVSNNEGPSNVNYGKADQDELINQQNIMNESLYKSKSLDHDINKSPVEAANKPGARNRENLIQTKSH